MNSLVLIFTDEVRFRCQIVAMRHVLFSGELFVSADGKTKRRVRKGVDEVVESDFEWEIVSEMTSSSAFLH